MNKLNRRSEKSVQTFLLILVILASTGCGQTGELRLPEDKPITAEHGTTEPENE